MRLTCLLLTAALVGTSASAQTGMTAVPGARAGDKQLTCTAIETERSEIAAAATTRASGQQLAAKRKKSAFGFLKNVAAQVVPGRALGIGGVGGQAAYVASGQAIAAADTAIGAAPRAVTPSQTKDETDRLARLDAIAAYRQCAN